MKMSIKSKFAILVGVLMGSQVGLLWLALGEQEGAGIMLAIGGALWVVGAFVASAVAGVWVGNPIKVILDHLSNTGPFE